MPKRPINSTLPKVKTMNATDKQTNAEEDQASNAFPLHEGMNHVQLTDYRELRYDLPCLLRALCRVPHEQIRDHRGGHVEGRGEGASLRGDEPARPVPEGDYPGEGACFAGRIVAPEAVRRLPAH